MQDRDTRHGDLNDETRERIEEAAETFVDIEEQTKLLTDWEETDQGISAHISTDEGRIQTEFIFHHDGAVTETISVIDDDGNELVTDSVVYEWEDVQRGFLKDLLNDLTTWMGNSRQVRLTSSEAAVLVKSAEFLDKALEDDWSEWNPDAREDLANATDRIREAFTQDPEVDDGFE